MSRKVTLYAKVKLIVCVDEGIELFDFLNEMDYSFTDTTGQGFIEDTEIVDYDVVDSK